MINPDKLNYFLTRFKPIYTKYITYNNFNPQLTTPYIVQQHQQYPQVNVGNDSVYNVIAGGSETLHYQWEIMTASEYGNGGTWQLLCTDGPTVTIQAYPYDQYIRVIVSNTQGSVTSDIVLCLAGIGGVN